MGATATARVTLTVEIDIGSTWGDDCKLSQVYDQAKEQAVTAVKNVFQSRVTIIGVPTVNAIVTHR
jgi:hypothetical protein